MIKYDLVHVVHDFISLSKILKEINETFLFLVPKVDELARLKDFRLIILCNTIYKILSKVFVHRMKPLMDKIIKPT